MALTIDVSLLIPSAAAQREYGVLGDEVTAGMPVYRVSGDTWEPANAAVVTASSTVGLAELSGYTGQRIPIITRDPALVHGITASQITPGVTVLLDDATNGMIITYTDLDNGDFAVILGQINNPETTMNFNPLTPVLKGA
jgi:hypothetical protein